MTGDLKLHLVESFQDAENFLTWLGNDREWLGLDTETEGLVLGKHEVKLVQFGDTHEAWAIPFDRKGWGGLVQTVFDQYDGKYVLHNAKFDMGRLERAGVRLPKWRQVHDTHVMSFLHDNQEPSRQLKRLAKKYLGIEADLGQQQLKKWMKETGHDWESIPIDTPLYWQYGALDATLTAALADKLWASASVFGEAYDMEMAAIKVLMHMEDVGLLLDVPYTEHVLEERLLVKADIDRQLEEANVRPNNPQDIVRYFTERGVKVPVKRSKKTGKISVDDNVLEQVDHPFAKVIHESRQVDKHVKTYLIKLLEFRDGDVLHTHINPLEARSGRMSCTSPALHQLEKSPLIRDCIVAREGQSLLSVDYENEELRIIGSLCNSKGMIEAFRGGMDMHKNTASKMYGIPIEQVSKQQKTNAKRAMFTKAYGGREATFSAYMGLTYEEGARYYQTLSMLYPELDEYIEHQKQTIKSNKVDGYGHIFLSDGRRINIPANLSFTAVSYSSQGEGAIVLKKKLIAMEASGLGKYLRLPIHDEILFEVPDEEFEEVRKEAMAIMTCTDFTVPLTVDGSGPIKRWGDEYREETG